MNTHGGKRPGAGRPKGTGTGRKTTTRSVSMPTELWDRIEQARGDTPRGQFIAEILSKHRKLKN